LEQTKKKKKQGSLQILPLGGLGEIGKNMMVFEYAKEMVLIDCGIMFPDDEYLGIDLILPDFNYVKAKKEKLKAILITHGHEDHIGALPFFYKDFTHVPLYAPQLAMELIKSKFDEHGVTYNPDNLIVINNRFSARLGHHFKAEFISVNHSISDSFAIVLNTPIGIVLHTGDFKIDFNPIDNKFFDFYKFAALGEKGVTLLLSDSTNIEKKFADKNEKDVGVSLSKILENAKGRVIVATFASNISRIAQLIKIGTQQDRKVALFGRNMEGNFEIARRLGYLEVSDQFLLSSKDLKNYPENKQLIITTGSQGEPMSALSLISQGIHKAIKIKPHDTVILSASVIPGNEKTVSRIINSLFLQGAQVFYEGADSVHVSGHATQEQLQLMLRMVKPQFFMPIHGEPRHLIQHANMVVEMGWHPDNVVLAKNGDLIEVTPKGVGIVDHVEMDMVFVDSNTVGDAKKLIRERKVMSEDGVIFAIVGLKVLEGQVECMPDVTSKGFFFGDDLKAILEKIKEIVSNVAVEKFSYKNGIDYNAVNNGIKKAIERYVQKNFSKNPMVMTRIIEIES